MKFTTNHHIVLASSSPRRKELFEKLGIPFEIITSDVEEKSVTATFIQQYVQEVALLKGRDVAKKAKGKTIISADTIVAFQNKLLHKPKTAEEAINHLKKLSNNQHSVLTGVALIMPDGTEETFYEETIVYFKKLPKQLIDAYVKTNDPYDKAGGYGIQTSGMLFVDRIEGDYNNVVGLPVASLFEKLVARNIINL